MIVDDEVLVRIGIKHSITWDQNGFELIGEASDGKEALEMIQKLAPDIVILDINMPVLNGIEVLRELKEQKYKGKVTEAPDVELKYLAVPKGGNGNGGGTMHTAALVALKNSKHLDAAMKVMQFAFGNENLYKATVEVTSVIPANSEYFDLYREQLPDLAPLVDYLETSQPFAYPTQSKKFADRLISLMQEALMNEESTLTGQEIVTQLAEEFGNK